MIKKYLTKPEEIVALKDTDTKIYKDKYCGYFKFVGGVFCYFSTTSDVYFNAEIGFNQVESQLYIEVEEPVKEATEKDIGCLCYFYEDDTSLFLGILDEIDEEGLFSRKGGCAKWTHCKRLTPEEVAKVTGYKVEK